MKGNFGLYVVPQFNGDPVVFKIDYSTGKTWQFTLGAWRVVKDA